MADSRGWLTRALACEDHAAETRPRRTRQKEREATRMNRVPRGLLYAGLEREGIGQRNQSTRGERAKYKHMIWPHEVRPCAHIDGPGKVCRGGAELQRCDCHGDWGVNGQKILSKAGVRSPAGREARANCKAQTKKSTDVQCRIPASCLKVGKSVDAVPKMTMSQCRQEDSNSRKKHDSERTIETWISERAAKNAKQIPKLCLGRRLPTRNRAEIKQTWFLGCSWSDTVDLGILLADVRLIWAGIFDVEMPL